MESVKLEEGFVAFGVLVPTNAKMFGVTKIPKGWVALQITAVGLIVIGTKDSKLADDFEARDSDQRTGSEGG